MSIKFLSRGRANTPKTYEPFGYGFPQAPDGLDINKHWCRTDSRKSYRRRPHPAYDSKSITYQLNFAGFRSPLFKQELIADPDCYKVVVFGGSETFGVGLPARHLYANLLSTKLEKHLGKTVVVWNLGLPGAGADFTARILDGVIEKLAPDFLFLNFAEQYGNREYVNDDADVFFCEAANAPHRQKVSRFLDPQNARVDRAHCLLENGLNCASHWHQDYTYCEYVCNSTGINWLFTAPAIAGSEVRENLYEGSRQVQPTLGELCQGDDQERLLARDWLHPGEQPNAHFADLILSAFAREYGHG